MSSSRTVRLGDCVEFLSGFPFKSGEFNTEGMGVPVIRIRDVKPGFSHTYYSGSYDPKYVISDGDYLIGMDGEFALSQWRGGPAVLNQRVCSLRSVSNDIDLAYVARLLPPVLKRIEDATPFATVKHLSVKTLREIELEVPPLPEQRRVVAVLDNADSLRAKRRQALALLDDLAKSIFLDMFGDPLRNPRNWIREKVSSLLLVRPSYGTMIPANEQESDHLCIRVANIQNWSLDLSSRKYVDLPPGDFERHGVSSGDLLMARAIATQEHLGKAIVAEPGDEKWAFDSHILRLRFDPTKANPHYIQALLATPGGRSIFLKATRRSLVQYNINSKEISALVVPVPPIAEQERFRSALNSVDRARKTHRTHLSALDELFTSVQQRAFSGTLWDHEAAA